MPVPSTKARIRAARRDPRSTRVPSRVLIALLCAVMAGIAIALFQSVRAERAAREQVELTTDVLQHLRTSLRTALDAETGQRGYLLTNDPVYLDPYERAERQWLASIDALEDTLGSVATPEQTAAIGRMRTLATAKLVELARTIEIARAGDTEEALRIVTSDEGRRLMSRFRDEVAALEDQEQLILATFLARAEVVEARTLPILVALAVSVIGLVVLGLWLERRTALAEADAREADELRRARERSDLLARELNHRVKNLFAVVLSVVSLSGRGATDVKDVVRKIRERVHALSLAHAVSQGQLDQKLVGLRDVLSATLEPYAGADGLAEDEAQQDAADGRAARTDAPARRVVLVGPLVDLPVRAVTPIGLVTHELATNAAKYGALSVPGGHVRVEWSVTDGDDDFVGDDPVVTLRWIERGGPPTSEPGHTSFGSLMLRQAAQQLGARFERRWTANGLEAEITFALPRAASVSSGSPPPPAEASAPHPALTEA